MDNNQNMEMNPANAAEPMAAENMELPESETSPRARKKQKIILAAVLMICMAIFATGTLAYFTAEETAYNVITTGILSMDLVEETTGGEPWPEEGISGVMPGMEVDKVPYVRNNGGIDFWTRISVSMTVTGENGNELSAEYISLDFNRESWTEKDGYYYCNAVVEPGRETEPLFTKVTFDTDMPNAYMNARIEIDVHAEAVQSRNNGISALTASGWTDAE